MIVDMQVSPKKSERVRSTAKPKLISAVQLDKEDSSSLSDESEFECSEDEWDVSSKKKRKKAKKVIPKQKQTLKLKLLEKTRKLRQLAKQNNAVVMVMECAKQEDISETLSVEVEKVNSSSASVNQPELNENKSEIETLEDSKPPFGKLIWSNFPHNDVNKVENHSSSMSTSIKNEAPKEEMIISETVKENCNQKQVVIEYSIDHSQISSATASSYLPSTTQANLSSISSHTLPGKNSFNVKDVHVPSTNVNYTSIDRANENQKYGLNSRNSTCTRSEHDKSNITARKRPKVSEIRKNSVSSKRLPPAKGPNSFRVVKSLRSNDTLVSRTQKMKFLSPNRSHISYDLQKTNKNSVELSVIRNNSSSKQTNSSLTTKTSDYLLNKFGNISPSGTVIHTGTGSVTITPRKTVPQDSPIIQRKLFKNEIEGTISVRSIDRSLRYVVNLANGTYIVLSDLQVEKLRQQHKGALPIKLKIPVPSDVADKIEPSFLIED